MGIGEQVSERRPEWPGQDECRPEKEHPREGGDPPGKHQHDQQAPRVFETGMAGRSCHLGSLMAEEDGVEAAIRLIERHLGHQGDRASG